jgi:hypothetical protein
MREVSDLYLTALLRLRGHQPMRVLGDGRRARWVFESTPELESDIAAFYGGTLTLPAREYAEAIRSCKGEAVQMAASASASAR